MPIRQMQQRNPVFPSPALLPECESQWRLSAREKSVQQVLDPPFKGLQIRKVQVGLFETVELAINPLNVDEA